ncbi:MAG TPA: fatty acid desaturase [Verrucomicrobiae bacterium]|nr:fatty acid desaturase [Verrucomicrobiae bacterium]
MLQPMRALVPCSDQMVSRLSPRAGRTGRQLIALRYAADWRTLGFLSLLGVLFFVQWTGILRHWSLLAATCILSFVACIIKHNHIHCRTFASGAWNRVFEYVLGFCTGQSTAAIIPVHNERHHARNHSDEDFVRSTLVNYRRNWLNLAMFPLRVVWLVHKNKSADISRWRLQKPRLWRRVRQERAAVLLFLALLLVLNWRATLLYFGIPWIFGQWGIVTINLLQHQDCDHDSEFDHSRNITGAFTNWLFLNNGFHTAHHLRPAIHWSRLPEFHRENVEPRISPKLNHRSLLTCVWKQFFSGARGVHE